MALVGTREHIPAYPRITADRPWRAAGILALAGLLAYANSFGVPFLFDDIPAIAENTSIRGFARPGELLFPPSLRGSSAAGRPVVNISLALNRWLGGEDVRGYHLFNLLVHVGAGLALFGVVRRTLSRSTRPGLRSRAGAVSFAAALIWLVHPLQTESVTCIIQRTESLAGLFYLLTFYAFLRRVDSPSGWRWSIACWVACMLGAATKELVATAPVLVFLFDRTFVAGSFGEAWRQRRWLHLSLLSSWLLVAVLVWRSDVRGGTVGFGHGVSAWEYLLTQCRAITLYLKLGIWPFPLVLDYGTAVIREPADVWGRGLLILAILGATIWALVRRPAWGFLGAWFFVILAPSSSFIPLVTQTLAEHRMYLPLAAVVVAGVVGLHCLAGRWFRPAIFVVAAALTAGTFARNEDYRSEEAIWRDTVAKVPDNARAYFSLAHVADAAGRSAEAIEHGLAAVRLVPADATAHFNLAYSFAKASQLEQAVQHYREAARLRPEKADAFINLGSALFRLGRLDEAMAAFETVVRLSPNSAEDEFNLAQIYMAAGRVEESVPHYEAAARLKPDDATTRYRLGNAYVKAQRLIPALDAYREALRLDPRHFEAHVNLAGALLAFGRVSEAIDHYEQALRLQPGDARVIAALADARARPRR